MREDIWIKLKGRLTFPILRHVKLVGYYTAGYCHLNTLRANVNYQQAFTERGNSHISTYDHSINTISAMTKQLVAHFLGFVISHQYEERE